MSTNDTPIDAAPVKITPLGSFWTASHIPDEIASHIATAEFWNCIQVSKSLYTCFVPFLWRNVGPFKKQASIHLFLGSPGQPCYRQHLRNLCIRESDVRPLMDHLMDVGPFPSLVSFECIDKVTGISGDSEAALEPVSIMDLIAFGSAHSQLQTLAISGQELNLNPLSALESMLTPGGLKTLKLTLNGSLTNRDLANFLRNCIHLDTLVLRYIGNHRAMDEELSDVVFEQTTIRQFDACLSRVNLDAVLLRFLEVCPLLENLELETRSNTYRLLDGLGDILGTCCPRLKRLVLPPAPFYDEELDFLEVTKLLNGCSSLSYLQFCLPQENESILEAICARHGETLEHLEFWVAHPVRMDNLFKIAHSCPLLKYLDVKVNWGPDPAHSLYGLMNSLERHPWQCMGLETLRLSFSSRTDFGSLKVLEVFLQQLGQMTRLRSFTLSAGSEFQELFLAGLGYLVRLKDLETFILDGSTGVYLTEEQEMLVPRMWPKLQRITCIAPPRLRGRGPFGERWTPL